MRLLDERETIPLMSNQALVLSQELVPHTDSCVQQSQRALVVYLVALMRDDSTQIGPGQTSGDDLQGAYAIHPSTEQSAG